jgi:hypothetical protein
VHQYSMLAIGGPLVVARVVCIPKVRSFFAGSYTRGSYCFAQVARGIRWRFARHSIACLLAYIVG